MNFISAKDAERISAAITDAERNTSGEIVAVVAEQSSRYQHIPVHVGGAAGADHSVAPHSFHLDEGAMDLSNPAARISRASGARVASQSADGAGAEVDIANANARRRASEQFLAQNLHTTTGRTGVLIFVSIAEQRVEIIADSGIDARCRRGRGRNIVDDFTREIGAGRRSTASFTRSNGSAPSRRAFSAGLSIDPNELSDHLIVLRN